MAAAEQLIIENLDIWSSAIKTKSAAGRGKSNKLELYGIKKLRELILELAVRGLLVPQGPNDEPASELLTKIAAEKAQLVKDKKIKKPKAIPSIEEGEMPFELPDGWAWARIAEIAQVGPRNEASDDDQVSFVPMPLITTNYDGSHGQEIREWSEVKKGYTHFADGDFAIAKITPCFENSKAAIFSGLKNGIGAGTTELHVARPYGDFVNRRYALLYLKAPQFLLVGEGKMTGTAGQKRVPKDFFALNPLPFPPLAEQNRIVAKVDELMALCDQLEQQQETSITAHQTLVQTLLDALTTASERDGFAAAWARIADHFDTLFTTEWSIDQLKQTILQLAVMGKLVPQDPNDEPAIELLKKIAAEKARLVKEGKIRKPKALPAIEEDEKPFELPEGWEWVRLTDVYDVRDGTHDTPKYHEKGYPLVTSKNLYRGKLDLANVKYISASDHKKICERSKVDKQDILFAMIGSIGNPVLIETDVEFSIKNVALFKYYSDVLSCPDFLLRYLLYAEAIFREQASGAVQSFVSLGKIRGFPIALPPLSEQARIVAKVDELMALCDILKTRLNTAQTTQLQLADAMAEQAVA